VLTSISTCVASSARCGVPVIWATMVFNSRALSLSFWITSTGFLNPVVRHLNRSYAAAARRGGNRTSQARRSQARARMTQ
jgi:hypothetical protein